VPRLVAVATTLFVALVPAAAGGGSADDVPSIARIANPAWSPTRAEIAFDAQFVDGTQALVIAAPDGSGVRRVEPAHGLGRPLWSPNGNRLALDGFDGRTPFVSVVSRLGGPAVEVGFGDTTPGSWSPDSTHVALIGVDPTNSPTGVTVVDANGAPSGTVWDGYGPAWSRRNVIAFTWGAKKEIYGPEAARDFVYTSDANGRHRHRLFRGSNPSWSSDGRRLAYTTTQGVFLARASGRGRRLVLRRVRTSGGDTHLRWAPGRSLLAVTTGGTFVVDVARRSVRRLDLPKGVGGEPSWSNDGRRLVFAAGSRLYIVGADGSRGHFVTPT
jgi:Tol biopolymer transport system component